MIQENVSVKEFPISFDLEPISNICASSLRKMQKKDKHKSFLSWPRAHLKNVHGNKETSSQNGICVVGATVRKV